MIIQTDSGNFETVGLAEKSTEMRIDGDSLNFLFKTFSDTLYSDKIGSIVREITSNCFDSHAEAGVNLPVMIHLKEPEYSDENSGSIIFEDFGVGISPERMESIFSCYFASTKRTTNNQIGGFGIGSKSPLAYTNVYTIQTVYNKVEYLYVINRGETKPSIDLVNKETTEKSNGSKIIIPIKTKEDFRKFINAIKTQLKFFDNVVVNHPLLESFNKAKIYRGKHFIVREGDNGQKAGICLGKVTYPLNLPQIDESPYDFNTPIHLLVDIGDIGVTLNREAVDYSENTINFLKEKMKLVRKEIKELIEKQGNEYEDLYQYLEARKKDVLLDIGNGYRVSVDGFYSGKVPCKFTPLANFPIEIPDNPFFEYYIDSYILADNKVIKPKSRESIHKVLQGHRLSDYTLIRASGSLSKRKNIYMHDVHGKCAVLRYHPVAPRDKEYIVTDKNLSVAEMEETIKKFDRFILKYVIDRSVSYDKTDIPEAWMKEYTSGLKLGKSAIDKNTQIICHIPNVTSGFYQSTRRFKDIEDFLNVDGFSLIYGSNYDEHSLRMLHIVLDNIDYINKDSRHPDIKFLNIKGPFLVCKLSSENIKIVSRMKGAIHVKDFINNNPKLIAKCYYFTKLASLRKEAREIHDKFYWILKREIIDRAYVSEVFRFSGTNPEGWLEKIMEYNDWFDVGCTHSGVNLPEKYKEVQKIMENLDLANTLDAQKLRAKDARVYKMLEFALKTTNLKFYYHAKDFCNS